MKQRADALLPDGVLRCFSFAGEPTECAPYGSGHIEDTYLLRLDVPGKGEERVILQRMNKEVFPDPEAVMENILSVTSYLKKQIIARGGDPKRETLNVIPAGNGKPFAIDPDGVYWRAFHFIEGATCYDEAGDPAVFYESAVAFGRFLNLLSDYPADTLHETIRGFHDTAARFTAFEQAVREDKAKRAAFVSEEIRAVEERAVLAKIVPDLVEQRKIPLRVTHNDTKLNNVMIDDATGKGICVIDLDTVMPGYVMNDFGDAVRYGANTAAEDEQDLAKVFFDLTRYEAFVKGYLKGCAGGLCAAEISLLPAGAFVMTYECGMRFLTDYLNGDLYFKTSRADQNLDRCRTQLALLADMEKKRGQMEEIILKYA